MEAANEPRHVLFDGAAEQGLSPIALKPWSLEFTDAAVEARYATIKFTSTYMPFVTFLGAVILLTTLMAVVDAPSSIVRHAGSSLVSTGLMCGRVYLHQLEDQQRARRLFGRAAVVTAAATAAWLPQAQPPEPISGSVMIAGAVLWFMIPMYLRHIALFFEHHLVYLLVIITGYLFKPPFSELGWFAETILIIGALVLGEIMGYLIESHMRLSYLERASEAPSAAPPPDPASTNTTLVHPWSLEFTNAAAEANYAAAKFAATYAIPALPRRLVCRPHPHGHRRRALLRDLRAVHHATNSPDLGPRLGAKLDAAACKTPLWARVAWHGERRVGGPLPHILAHRSAGAMPHGHYARGRHCVVCHPNLLPPHRAPLFASLAL